MAANKGAKGFEKHRTYRKIDLIPQEIRADLDEMLSDASLTYEEITKWLNTQLEKNGITGEDGEPMTISRSSVGRYAFRTKQLAIRYNETMKMMREVIKLAQEKPDENINEGALQMGMLKLAEKLATEDFENISGVEAMKLITNISRTKAYKDKVYAGLKSDYEKGYEQFLKRVTAEIEARPELIAQLETIAQETLGKML